MPGSALANRDVELGLTEAYEAFLRATPGGYHDGTAQTPLRAVAALRELTAGYDVDVAGLFTTFDPDGYDGMVVARKLPYVSMCEHHLLPVTGVASIVYIPDGKVLGLSKMPRLVHAYARRLQQQERMTRQIADALVEHLDPVGVMVVVEGVHSCMTHRGVQTPGEMLTSALRGALRDNPATRAEAEWLIGL